MSLLGSLNPFKQPKGVTSSTLDPTSQQAIKDAYTAVGDLNKKGYTPYEGDKVAVLSANEMKALRTPVNTGIKKNYYQPASSLAKQSAASFDERYDPTAIGYDKVSTDTWNSGAAEQYMNPYVDKILSPVLEQIKRTSSLTQNNIGSRAAARRAFGQAGKDRMEIANNRDTAILANDATNKVYSDAFNAGLEAFLADQARKLQADTSNQSAGIDVGKFNENQVLQGILANAGIVDQNNRNARAAAETLAGIGRSEVDLNQANRDNLLKTGALATDYRQKVLDSKYQDFLDEIAQQPGGQQYIDNLLSIISAGKGGQTTAPGQSIASQIAGAAAAAYAASDIRLKENITEAGVVNGFKLYDFNYIGKPSERYRGVMAQEVRMIKPEAVYEMPDGFLAVDYSLLGFDMVRV